VVSTLVEFVVFMILCLIGITFIDFVEREIFSVTLYTVLFVIFFYLLGVGTITVFHRFVW
jgi:hypothetical protein